MAAKLKPHIRVYSYIRFSSDEQSKGDSTRRQIEWRDRYLQQNPTYQLDDKLTLHEAKAQSAFKGEHRKRGALGKFLEAVQQGNIQPGSILLVENVDRLTRLEPFDALEMLCFGLIKHGIAIQTQIARYDREAMNNGQIHGLIAEINRAYQESKYKSERVTAARDTAFKAARETGKIVTAQCPAWLEKYGDKFRPIPEAATTIALIFNLKLDGLSQRKIEARLNAEAPWTPPPKKNADREAGLPGGGWRISYIKKILANRAAIGEYQPYRLHKVEHNGETVAVREPDGAPITGYYPPVLTPEVFHAVQRQLAANKGKGGRTGAKRNIFTHLIKCAYCGGVMRHTDKGRDWQYLVCDNAARGIQCQCHNVRYVEVRDLVLEGCVYLKPEQVLPATDEQAITRNILRQEIVATEAMLQDAQDQAENLFDLIKKTKPGKAQDMYAAEHERLLKEADTLAETVKAKRRELANAESAALEFDRWQKGLPELIAAIGAEDAADIRARLAAHLREFIERIEIYPVGFKVVADPEAKHDPEWEYGDVISTPAGGRSRGVRRTRKAIKRPLPAAESILEYLDEIWHECRPDVSRKQWGAFEKYVLARRMSREGRFYRILFKTGESVDLVPAGGLATGMNHTRGYGGVREKLPDFNRLWEEFQEKNGK